VVLVLQGLEAPSKGGLWFAGWDWRVPVCALGWVPATWMSTLITARFSTVVKNLVQCLSTVVTYFLALMDPSHKTHSLPATAIAFVVMLSVTSFTLQSAHEDSFARSNPSGEGHWRAVDKDVEHTQSTVVRRRTSSLVSVTSVLDLAVYADFKRSESDPPRTLEEWEAILGTCAEDFPRHHTF